MLGRLSQKIRRSGRKKKRGTVERNQAARSQSFTKRDREQEKEAARKQSQDDSVVYSATDAKSKSTKPARRGESFSIRRLSKKEKKEESEKRPSVTSPPGVSPWHSEDKKQKRHSVGSFRSNSAEKQVVDRKLSDGASPVGGDDSMQYPHHAGAGDLRQTQHAAHHASFHSLQSAGGASTGPGVHAAGPGMHGAGLHAPSVPSLHRASPTPGYESAMSPSSSYDALSPSASWPHGPLNAAWKSMDTMSSGHAAGGPPLHPRNRQGLSFDHIDHNLTPKNSLPSGNTPDYKTSYSMHDVRQRQPGYSPSPVSSYHTRPQELNRPFRAYGSSATRDYENIETLDSGIGSGSNTPRMYMSPAASSPSLYKNSPESPGPPPPPPDRKSVV